MSPLWEYVGLAWTRLADYQPDVCIAWIESSGRRCKRPGDEYLCPRHRRVAERRRDAEQAKQSAARIRNARSLVAAKKWRLDDMRSRLARIEGEVARRSGSDLPRDMAAYGGSQHRSITRRQASINSDSNIARCAELMRQHKDLAAEIASIEGAVALLEES